MPNSSAAPISTRSACCRPRTETRAFLADTSADKRDRLIERCSTGRSSSITGPTNGPTCCWSAAEKLRPPAMWAYYNWIRKQVAANTPWDEFARQIVTASGSTLENGAANFYRAARRSDARCRRRRRRRSSGMSINCAKCHNHPMEKWTNDQYYAWPTCSRACGPRTAAATGNTVIFAASDGDLVQPLTGKPQPPHAAGREALPLDCAGGPPRSAWRIGWFRPKIRISPARSPIASGRTSWASAWSKRSMTCG